MKLQVWARVDKETLEYIDKLASTKEWTRSGTINKMLKEFKDLEIYKLKTS